MKRLDFTIHVTIAAVWIGLALLIGVKIALLGNEAAALAKGRGADRKAQLEIAIQQVRIRDQLEWEASPPQLEDAVRRLQLPLRPVESLADRARQPAAVMFANHR